MSICETAGSDPLRAGHYLYSSISCTAYYTLSRVGRSEVHPSSSAADGDLDSPASLTERTTPHS